MKSIDYALNAIILTMLYVVSVRELIELNIIIELMTFLTNLTYFLRHSYSTCIVLFYQCLFRVRATYTNWCFTLYSTYFVFPFLKLSNKMGGGDRGDCCDTDICGFVADIDAIGSIRSVPVFSLSLIIGWFTLQSTILTHFYIVVPLRNFMNFWTHFSSDLNYLLKWKEWRKTENETWSNS